MRFASLGLGAPLTFATGTLLFAFVACGDNLSVDESPSLGDDAAPTDGGGSTPPDAARIDGATPQDADAGSCPLSGSSPAPSPTPGGMIDSSFTTPTVLLVPPNISPTAGFVAASVGVLPSNNRIVVVGEANTSCKTMGAVAGPHAVVAFFRENGGDVDTAACPGESNGPTFLRGVSFHPTGAVGQIFLSGYQASKATVLGMNETGATTFENAMAAPRSDPSNQAWTNYGVLPDEANEGLGVTIVGASNHSGSFERGYLERVVRAPSSATKLDDAFTPFAMMDGIAGFRSIARLPNGGIAIGGTTTNSSAPILKRFTRTGAPLGVDTTGPLGQLLGLASDPEGKVVGVVTAADTATLFRTDATGALEAFWTRRLESGGLSLVIDGTRLRASSTVLARQCDGKWLVGGHIQSKPAVARLLTTGDLDTSYGNGGFVTIDAPTVTQALDVTGLALDSKQRLVVLVGAENRGFFLYRLLP